MEIKEIVISLVSLISGGALTVLIKALTQRIKTKAEAEQIDAQSENIYVTSEIKIGEFTKLLADGLHDRLNEQLERYDALQVQLDIIKMDNLELKATLQRNLLHKDLEIETLRRQLKEAKEI